jgi:hypothetical protein
LRTVTYCTENEETPIRALEGARFEVAELVGAAIVVGSLMANNLMLRRGRRVG